MDTDRIIGRMRRLTTDPDRWVDSDMQRDEWLLVARYRLLTAAAATFLVVVVGVAVKG